MKSKAQPRKERLFSSSQNSLRQSGEAPVARRRHWEQTSQTQGLRVPCPASRGRKAKRIFWFICKQAQTLQRLSIPACANPGIPEPGCCPYGAAVPTLPSARGTTFLPDGGGGGGLLVQPVLGVYLIGVLLPEQNPLRVALLCKYIQVFSRVTRAVWDMCWCKRVGSPSRNTFCA